MFVCHKALWRCRPHLACGNGALRTDPASSFGARRTGLERPRGTQIFDLRAWQIWISGRMAPASYFVTMTRRLLSQCARRFLDACTFSFRYGRRANAFSYLVGVVWKLWVMNSVAFSTWILFNSLVELNGAYDKFRMFFEYFISISTDENNLSRERNVT